jgi:hypothetical protein|tara:strand:+ start:249 stop:434 length:186 start_codon:yes stop_codon:yes gene_type:complete
MVNVFFCKDKEDIKCLNSSMSVIIYQEEIELLEEEKAELQKEVLFLRRKLKYYQQVLEEEQ